MSAPVRTSLLDAQAIGRALHRMALEIVALAGGTERLVLVGIQRRGVELAERIGVLLRREHGADVQHGALDITLYRDDLNEIGPRPVIGETRLPHELDGKVIVIVDDVLFTGRTIRAALDQIADFGRPARIGLAVLIDRGGRELPIQADIVGERVPARPGDRVDVLLAEVDGRDAVELVRGSAA
ncbi:MAG: bifunctional pyr operon transcriptional regulator/uracil phosphoribosyltransferase PyrR [Gemmatimonadota bacterium]|nr:bifunctional pyr operon transcriptional regulator/uracil phosphoribosyltransferase PyrR [Gemmatimonadota bacterium]